MKILSLLYVSCIVSLTAFQKLVIAHAGISEPLSRVKLTGGISSTYYLREPMQEDYVTPFFANGELFYKHFPCGTPDPTKIIVVESHYINFTLDVNNEHFGGSCQYALSYDGKTFVSIYETLNTCLSGMGGSNHKMSIPLPKNLPKGRAIFSWSWVTNECLDIELKNGASEGEVIGKPFVAANYNNGQNKREFLFMRGDSKDYNFLYNTTARVILKVDRNGVNVFPKEFANTKHLRVNDPLFKYFKEPLTKDTGTWSKKEMRIGGNVKPTTGDSPTNGMSHTDGASSSGSLLSENGYRPSGVSSSRNDTTPPEKMLPETGAAPPQGLPVLNRNKHNAKHCTPKALKKRHVKQTRLKKRHQVSALSKEVERSI